MADEEDIARHRGMALHCFQIYLKAYIAQKANQNIAYMSEKEGGSPIL